MTETTRCEHCGVLDALGRHDGACSYALDVGLPRLAEGEPPIDPNDPDEGELGPEDPNLESGYDGPVAEEGEVSPNHPAHPQWHDRPGDIQRAPSQATHSLIRERPPATPELWMAWIIETNEAISGTDYFDARVFSSEIDALRYAVREGWHVVTVELGTSLREQATKAEPL